jgi:hypothetical protein
MRRSISGRHGLIQPAVNLKILLQEVLIKTRFA